MAKPNPTQSSILNKSNSHLLFNENKMTMSYSYADLNWGFKCFFHSRPVSCGLLKLHEQTA